MAQRFADKKDLRVLITNLNYDTTLMEIKDLFKKECGSAYVELLTKPTSGKSAGVATIMFKNQGEVQIGLGLSGTSLGGRPIKVQADPENEHLKVLATKMRLGVEFTPRGKPKLTESTDPNKKPYIKRDHDDSSRDRPRRDDRRERSHSDRRDNDRSGGKRPRFDSEAEVVLPGGYRLREADAKTAQRHGMAGKPLINDIRDLCQSVLFFTGFRMDTDDKAIRDFFQQCGRVNKISQMESDREGTMGKPRGCGTVEFTRARDASRAMIMLHEKVDSEGRRILLRAGRERREMPEGLANLGRPLPEPQVAQQCRDQGIDPFQPAEIYCGKLSRDCTKSGVKDIFNLVGDAYRIVYYTFKDDDEKIRGITCKYSSALDAQQCLNVLNDAVYLGRELGCRFEKSKEGTLMCAALVQGAGMPVGNPNTAAPQSQGAMPPPAMPQAAMPPPVAQPSNQGQWMNIPDTGSSNGYKAPSAAMPAPSMPAPQQAFYGGAPAVAPKAPRGQANSEEDDVKKLASKLGISAKMLKAIKVLAAEEVDEEPKAPKQQARSGPGPDYTRDVYTKVEPVTPAQNWTPTTADTIYIRNVPSHFNELRLRNYMNECGRVTFMDFPLKADGRPVGYAYVRFSGAECRQAVSKAIKMYNRCTIDGCTLEVGQY